MGDISKNFSRYEAACPCGCGQDGADYVLVKNLELIRAEAGGKPIGIISWNRCKHYNAQIPGASKTSQHLYGKGVDLTIATWSPKNTYQLIESLFPGSRGLGLYPGHVHFDSRATRHRWIIEAYPE